MSKWYPLSRLANTIVAILVAFLAGCASAKGPQIARALERGPLTGPPQPILRVASTMRRGHKFEIELALVGSTRYKELHQPVGVVLSILGTHTSVSTVTWGDPRIFRYFRWVIPALLTQSFNSQVTIHVAVYHFAGYTLTGSPVLSDKPFLRTSQIVKVQHPIANSGVRHRIHKTEVHD